ncbi:MAG TPA: hypothetical protein VH395_08995 [Jatrophihabitantaceae bacterium]|jgi:hypothetical protein
MAIVVVELALYLIVALIAFRVGLRARKVDDRQQQITRLLHPSRHEIVEPASHVESVRVYPCTHVFDFERDA